MASDRPVLLSVILARIFWLIVGPFLLMVMTYAIASRGGGWFTMLDLALLGVVAALIGSRWIEFRSGDPRTSTGQPATHSDLRQFVVTTLGVGLAIWVVANLFGNYW